MMYGSTVMSNQMMNSVPNFNISNIYNNYFNQSTPMMPQMTMAQTPMFQGQMFGGQSPMLQGQLMTSPMQMGQMQSPFGGGQFMQLLMNAMQSIIGWMMGSLGPSGQNQMFGQNQLQNPFTTPFGQNQFNPFGPQQIVKDEIEIHDKANVWGDPHYHLVGKDGKDIKFDHCGEAGKTYNVFSGDNLQIDGLYAPYGDKPCVIDTATVRAGSDVLTFNKSGEAALNGQKLEQKSGVLRDGTKYELNGKTLTVTPNDGTGKVNIVAQDTEMTVDPDGKFANLGGIVGTAISENRALSEEEANKFEIANNFYSPEFFSNLANPLNT